MRDRRCLPPEEDEKRWALYKQGLPDREIADKCGVSPSTIASWRKARTLGNNQKSVGEPRSKMQDYKFATKTGVPMEKTLTPDQCKVVRRFLSTLLKAHDMNPKLDISNFMKEYRYVLNGHYNSWRGANTDEMCS